MASFLDTIRHDVRQALVQQFAGTFLGAFAAASRKLPEGTDGLVNLDDRGMRQMRLVPAQIFVNAF
jgi:hypothetical protein